MPKTPISDHTVDILKDKTNMDFYTWGDNCTSYIILDTPNLSVKQEVMPPGTKERLHFHENATQIFSVLSGEASFYM